VFLRERVKSHRPRLLNYRNTLISLANRQLEGGRGRQMIRHWVVPIFVMLTVIGCSSSDVLSPFKDDRQHLTEAFAAFYEASELSQVPKGMRSYAPPEVDEKIDNLLKKGLREGDSVSDDFLNWLHPEMKGHFREELMRGERLNAEGRKESNVLKQSLGSELIGRWYADFWKEHSEMIFYKAFPKK
jgi:hypothetical protein